ncbi:MAG: FeoA family protein [Candidatus Kryptoniota bacterium]
MQNRNRFRFKFGQELSTDTVKTLNDLRVGEVAQITGFSNHGEIYLKIEAMGLRPGRKIKVLQRLGRGILVSTSTSRIVITSDVARSIEVKCERRSR